jgi:hypothetical protein
MIVGWFAFGGHPGADAAVRNNLWLAYPMNPAPRDRWVVVAWIGLGLLGAAVQLGFTAKHTR